MTDEMIALPPLPVALDYDRSMLPRPRPWGRGFLALCASFVFWGLGHWLAGSRRRGLVWFLIWLGISSSAVTAICVPRFFPALIFILPVQLLLTLIVLVDSFLAGRRSTRPMLGHASLRYLTGIGCLILAGAWNQALGMLIKAEVAEAFFMPTRSMMPTIQPGDRFVVYNNFTIHRWDVVALHPPETPRQLYTERIVGLPGETIEIRDGKLQVNGVPMTAPPGAGPYVGKLPFGREGPGCEGNPIALGPDEYYLLGDNSPLAGDARYWRFPVPGHQLGAVPRTSIVGRATTIYWPPARWRNIR